MVEQRVVRAEHTLDYDSFGFLVDAPVEDSIELDLLPGCYHFPSRMTLKGTESFIGQPAFVLEGTFKGYTGTLRLVTRNHAFVELPGLSDGNKVVRLNKGAVASP